MRLLDLIPWIHPGSAEIKLRLFGSREEPVTLSLADLPAVLGRGEKANIQVHDPMLSRTHCQLIHRQGRVVLRDLESRHGTWVNGRQIHEEALRVGDEVWIGTTRFIVLLLPEDETRDFQ